MAIAPGIIGERSRGRSLLLCLILAAMLARVSYLNQVAALPFFQDPVGDSAGSLARAGEILEGRFLPDTPFFYGGILYPWALAGFALLFGPNLYPVCLAQALMGCALVWAVHRLAAAAAPRGRRRHGRRAGLAAAALVTLYGPFAFLEADILMVSWTLLALAMAGGILLRARRRAQRGGPRAVARAALAGLLLGFAATERPNLVALLPCAALWAVWAIGFPGGTGARGRLRGLAAAGAIAGAGAVIIAPIAWMNHAASGRWVLLTTSGGVNFAIGNHEGARGTFDEPWSPADSHAAARDTDLQSASLMQARHASRRELDAVEASAYWWSQGWAWIRSRPWEAAKLTLRKAALLWSGQELPNHLHFDFLREVAPALWLMPLGFAWVAPLGGAALFWPAVRHRLDPGAWALLALLVLVPMATVLPFFVADRYRAAAVPALLAAAGWTIETLLRGAPVGPGLSRGRRGAAAVAGAMVLAGAALSYPLVETDRSRDHWMLAQAWKRQGRYDESVASYRRAVELSPADAVLRNNLGLSLALGGRPQQAEREYRRALALDPALAFPAKNLGLLLMREGKLEEARQWLERALQLEPGDQETRRALAALGEAPGPAAPPDGRAPPAP